MKNTTKAIHLPGWVQPSVSFHCVEQLQQCRQSQSCTVCLITAPHANSSYTGWLGALPPNPKQLSELLLDRYISECRHSNTTAWLKLFFSLNFNIPPFLNITVLRNLIINESLEWCEVMSLGLLVVHLFSDM